MTENGYGAPLIEPITIRRRRQACGHHRHLPNDRSTDLWRLPCALQVSANPQLGDGELDLFQRLPEPRLEPCWGRGLLAIPATPGRSCCRQRTGRPARAGTRGRARRISWPRRSSAWRGEPTGVACRASRRSGRRVGRGVCRRTPEASWQRCKPTSSSVADEKTVKSK